MTPARRLAWITGLLACIFFLIGWLGGSQLPQVRSWLLIQVKELSERHLPVRIVPTVVEVRPFPLGLSLKGLRILPKAEIKDQLDPAFIEEATVSVSILDLLQGRVRVKSVSVRGATVSARLPKAPKTSAAPLEGLFRHLVNARIGTVSLENCDVRLQVAEPKLRAELQDIDAELEMIGQALALSFSTSSTHLQDGDSGAAVRVEFETRALLEPKSVTVSELKLRRGESFLVASGVLAGDTEALRFDDVRMEARTGLQLRSMRDWAVKSLPGLEKIPPLKGRANVEAKIRRERGRKPEVSFNVETQGLYERSFFIDRIRASGTFDGQSVRMPKLEMINPGVELVLSDTEVRLSARPESAPHGPPAPATIRTTAEVTRAELHDFLKTLGLGEVGVYLGVRGKTPCHGTFTPRFELSCSGEMEGEDLIVNGKRSVPGSIVAIPRFRAEGGFTVDTTGVSYKTELRMPGSQGRSSGRVEYDKGFKIDYEADVLDMRDKANLSGLKIEGTAKLKGSTAGDSQSATFAMQIGANDMWFQDYWLGQAKADLSYKAGTLSFDNVVGHYATSRYSADVDVDLNTHFIRVNGRSPFFDSKDMLKVFSRRVRLPVHVTGTGKAEVRVWGPLEFTRLSYDLRTTMLRGTVAREAFDEANFDVRSRDGEVSIERVRLVKGAGLITMTGVGHPDGNIKTVIRGRGLRLEDMTAVNELGLGLSGQADFDMNLSGYVLRPDTDLKGTIVQTAIGDQGVPDSQLHLRFRENTIEGGGKFLGDVLKAEFTLPLNPQAPFKLELKTQDWNYAPLFAAIAGPGARRDYEGVLTADIDLASPHGGFWNATGRIVVPKFILRRGGLSMSAPRPLALSMTDGRVRVESFFLEGDGTFLRLVETSQPLTKADLQVNGKLDMSLMALILPFFEELRGMLSFAFNLRAGPGTAAVLGSVYVDKGYLKIFNFPHPFEDVRADFLFSDKKVLVNSLKADLAGGRVTGDGSIELKGFKNYPIQISALVEKVNLNLPENMRTSGSGRLFFTGNWFPFQMKGVYDVRSGQITREFSGESSPAQGVQRSTFLPRQLLEEDFAPLEMDVTVDVPVPIEIKNSLIEGKVSGKILLKGPPGPRTAVLGTVTAEKDSKIFFRDNTFDLMAGVATFSDPNELNPTLYMTARSRVSDYDVNLVLQGTAKKPELSLTSSPPLAEQDIISLLALGIPGQKIDDVRSRDNATSSGISIGGGFIKNNPAADQIKKTTGFDIGVTSSYDEANNVAVPKITAHRKITPKFGVTAARSIGNEPKTEAKIHYQLSNRFSIVGSWEGQELQENSDAAAGKVQENQDKIGLDFEYKFEFK